MGDVSASEIPSNIRLAQSRNDTDQVARSHTRLVSACQKPSNETLANWQYDRARVFACAALNRFFNRPAVLHDAETSSANDLITMLGVVASMVDMVYVLCV